jgi:hypothetical protein
MPSVSQQQQKLFGLALAVKRGEVPRSEASQDILDIVDSMSEKDIEDFASTKHAGLPKQVEEKLREMVRNMMRESIIGEGLFQDIMKGVKTGNGPFTLVVIKNNKVVKQVTVNTPQGVPANYTSLQKDYPNSRIRVEDATGKIVFGESVNEAASRTAMEIGGLTGMNKDAVQKFVDTHNLDIEKVFQFVKKGKLSDRMDFMTAVVGKPGNSIQKKMIKMFGESVNEAVPTQTKWAVAIASLTGTRPDAVQKFIDDNNLDSPKLYTYLKRGKLKERMDFVTALVGNPGNKIQKMIISKFGIKESVNESSVEIGDIVFLKKEKQIATVFDRFGRSVTVKTGNGKMVKTVINNIKTLAQDGVDPITEKQLKGLEGISPNQTLDKISKVQKLKIIKAPGNIITFFVPDWAKGSRNFWQVIGTGKIKKNMSGEFGLEGKGPMKSSPTFKTIDDLIDGVDWKSMEQTRRFNEGSTKHIDSLTEKLPNDFATIPNNGQVNGALKHLQHHTDVISKNVKAGKGVYKKDLMKMANIIKALQMYEGINESSVEIGDIVFFPSANSAATVVDRFGRSVTLKLANGKKVKTVVDKVKLLAQDGVNPTIEESTQINEWRAEDVLQQLGGKRFILMTGANKFVKNDSEKSITFKLPRAKSSIKYVKITLTSMDLYDVEFIAARGTNIKTVAKVKGVYNDQLQQVFTQHTGLYTRL